MIEVNNTEFIKKDKLLEMETHTLISKMIYWGFSELEIKNQLELMLKILPTVFNGAPIMDKHAQDLVEQTIKNNKKVN